MRPLFIQILKSRWLAIAVQVGLWVLLFLIARNLGGKTPPFHDATSAFLPTQALAPVTKLDPLFRTSPASLVLSNNDQDLFATRYFVPPPTPPPAPPPTTKKIAVAYQGFFETGKTDKTAIFKLPTGFVSVPIGKSVVTNYFVAEAQMQLLILTNQAGQTNLLPLNQQKELEIPVK